jgi:hypothetical protein
MSEKQERTDKANELIRVIAGCGRKFFLYKLPGGTDIISKMILAETGHIYFMDAHTLKDIYTHYTRRWRGFSEGGTLRDVIIGFRDYIRTGQPLTFNAFGPWPDWYSGGDPWGYGADMKIVHDAAVRLGIIKASWSEWADAVQERMNTLGLADEWSNIRKTAEIAKETTDKYPTLDEMTTMLNLPKGFFDRPSWVGLEGSK